MLQNFESFPFSTFSTFSPSLFLFLFRLSSHQNKRRLLQMIMTNDYDHVFLDDQFGQYDHWLKLVKMNLKGGIDDDFFTFLQFAQCLASISR